jgi:hypothetical protein
MAEKEKNDGDDELSEEEKEWYACDVQNPFVSGNIEVSEEQVSTKYH